MISIIVPCYNAEKTINRTIGSLINQTERDYEIVLVDDGSSDNTSSICDAFAVSDARIKVVHQNNRGLMGAWKRGVAEARGDYIAFCDADDYIDEDLIGTIYTVISDFSPELILYGMRYEYSNGKSSRSYNRLNGGFYDSNAIKSDILPHLLSDGSMQSELILRSRWSKVFKKDLLISVIPLLNEKISMGEDQLTMFATMQVVRSIYCIEDYCPYHYVRSSGSMIGGLDENVFVKLNMLYSEFFFIAKEYSYPYIDQILYDKLAMILLYVKKYFCRSDKGYKLTKNAVDKVRMSPDFIECIDKCSIRKYSIGTKIFAEMFIRRMYFLLYSLSRAYERIIQRGRDI